MTFAQTLNDYLETLNCTAQRLAEISGISVPTISRYRNGQRTPGNEALQQLAKGIAVLAMENHQDGMTTSLVYEVLSQSVATEHAPDVDFATMSARLRHLIETLDIRISELADYCNVDKSFISRICSGQRKPRDPQWIIHKTANYIVRHYVGPSDKRKVLELMGITAADLRDAIDYREHLITWLAGNIETSRSGDHSFTGIDSVDLDEFLRSCSFGKVKVSTKPQTASVAKAYFGNAGMEAGIVEFFKAAATSKSLRDMVLYNDHPKEYFSNESSFPQQWVKGIATSILHGIHINIIHNIDRPYREMVLGLEEWVPLYTSGEISGYYIDDTQNNTLHHLLLVAGNVALVGDAVPGHPETGQYTLYKANADVERYRIRAELLLKQAKPLVTIYRKDNAEELKGWVNQHCTLGAAYKRLLTSPPIFTISDELLTQILLHNRLSTAQEELIRAHVKKSREQATKRLKTVRLQENIAICPQEEFKRYPVTLYLGITAMEITLSYRYTEYMRHIQETKKFAMTHKNYQLTLDRLPDFRNIQMAISKGTYALAAKNESPGLYAVVKHPKIVNFFDHMVTLYCEETTEKDQN